MTSLLELKLVFFQAHLSGFLCKTPVFSFLINQLIMPAKCKRNSIHFEIITYHIHSCYRDSTLTSCGYNTQMPPDPLTWNQLIATHMQIWDSLCAYKLYMAFIVQEDVKWFTFFTVWKLVSSMTFCRKRV